MSVIDLIAKIILIGAMGALGYMIIIMILAAINSLYEAYQTRQSAKRMEIYWKAREEELEVERQQIANQRDLEDREHEYMETVRAIALMEELEGKNYEKPRGNDR